MSQHDLANAFRALHDRRGGILVLPNAWDVMSARIVEEAGARAIATTSAGVAWSLGRPDGEGLTRDEMLAAVGRIARAVRVPVTADVEGGYGTGTPADVAATARGVIDAGAVGLNLEDSCGPRELYAVERQAERIAAARSAASAAGVAPFVNARVDAFLHQVGPAEGRFDETVRRARAYVAAGADGIFVPGVMDAETIRRLVAAIDAPLNLMAGPGAPSTAELRALGVARVSVGPAIARAALGLARRAAAELLGAGTYEALREGVPYLEANALFARG